MIEITEDLSIPDGEVEVTVSTSSGPGGQNVNRVRTRVTLSFNVAGSPSLSEDQRDRIVEKLANRIDRQGNLRVRCQRHRTQAQNRTEAFSRLADLLRNALREAPARKQTRMPRAADERRLEEKRRRSRLKDLRGDGRDPWD